MVWAEDILKFAKIFFALETHFLRQISFLKTA